MFLRYHITDQTDPYRNLALEELLLERTQPDEATLFLWQNRRAVVIGRNQNAWRECNVEMLERDGGCITRRRSGGGAVYHDLGNLNFSFIARDSEYDLDRQFEVITAAMRKLGFAAERSGRNDIHINGRKFSGNAYFSAGGRSCHHGTILVDTDGVMLERYLNVSADKLISKGVPSARARVVNLCDLAADVTVERVRRALLESFAEVYDGSPQSIDETELPQSRISALAEHYESWDWRFGQPIPFTWSISRRFEWGGFELQLEVNGGIIKSAAAYSDALDADLICALPAALENVKFSRHAVVEAIMRIGRDAQIAQKPCARRGVARYARQSLCESCIGRDAQIAQKPCARRGVARYARQSLCESCIGRDAQIAQKPCARRGVARYARQSLCESCIGRQDAAPTCVKTNEISQAARADMESAPTFALYNGRDDPAQMQVISDICDLLRAEMG